jgi:hypothetical protein
VKPFLPRVRFFSGGFMLNHRSRSLSLFFALSLIAVACGDDDDDTGGTGGKAGSTSTGGKAGTGGTSTSGGTGAKGGTTSTGGTSNTGGKATGTGGVVSSGGTATTGGADAGGASGSAGEGGMPEGGSATGGGSTTGGSTTGGASTGGTAGTSTGGTAGADSGGAGGFGGDSVVGGAGGEGGEATVQITIVNADFETWGDPPTGWTETGAADASGLGWKDLGIPESAHSGHQYLNFYKAADYEVTTSQVVSSVPNGNYSLAIWQRGNTYIEQYVFVGGYNSADTLAKMTANTAPNATWVQIVISPIPVTNGQVVIGVYSKGVAEAWSHFDDVTLTKLP